MNCPEKEIKQLLPECKSVLYVQFQNPGEYFGFGYKCLVSRLLERWELVEEQVWDNFAVMTLEGGCRFYFVPESNLQRIKCVCKFSYSVATALRTALLKVTDTICSLYPQFTIQVLLKGSNQILAPEEGVRLAVKNGKAKFNLQTVRGMRSCFTSAYNSFFSFAATDLDVHLVHVSPSIAEKLTRTLHGLGFNVPRGFLRLTNLYGVEKSRKLVVIITRKFIERADNPLSEVADALQMGFEKGTGSVIPVILDSELLNVNNWPCTPFNLHRLPLIDFSTEQKREENLELLEQRLVETAKETGDNSFGI